jgi:purine-cytosine permease-like protein
VRIPAASIAALLRLGRAERTDDSAPLAEQSVEVHAAQELVPRMWWVGGLVCSAVLCTATISPLYGLPWWQPFVAVAVGLLVSVLAVRALGETDLNPVSL